MADTLLQLDRRLALLRQARPDLESAIALQEGLIRQALAAGPRPAARPFPLPRERLVHKVRAGTPLLHGEPAFVDVPYAADLFGRLLQVVAARREPEMESRIARLVEAATSGRLEPERLLGEAFVRHEEHLAEIALHAGVDHDLLGTLATLAVAPLLRAYAAQLRPLLEAADDGSPGGAAWGRGYCPICGGWPGLAELRGVELQRHLRCSACGHAWRSLRIFCPYCEADDFRHLRLLRAEGEQRFRVQACQRCHGYLKVGNAFDPPPAELLALDDLATLHLDVAAIERGYRRPGGTGFRLELAIPESEWAEELASLEID